MLNALLSGRVYGLEDSAYKKRLDRINEFVEGVDELDIAQQCKVYQTLKLCLQFREPTIVEDRIHQVLSGLEPTLNIQARELGVSLELFLKRNSPKIEKEVLSYGFIE